MSEPRLGRPEVDRRYADSSPFWESELVSG